jgi:hypothetical protein
MSDTVRSDPVVDPGSATSVTALTRTAFNAILQGRRLSRAELVQATGASPEDIDRLVGRSLMLDADERIVAVHGLSLVPARQHRLSMRGCRFWTWCAIDAVPGATRSPAGRARSATWDRLERSGEPNGHTLSNRMLGAVVAPTRARARREVARRRQ